MRRFASAVGEVLRAARTQRGMSLYGVERSSRGNLKPSAVGGYERGERTISLERFWELAKLYGIPADRLLAHALEVLDPRLRESIVIDLNRLSSLSAQESRAITKFVHTVSAQRGAYFTDTISLRAGDLEEVAVDAHTSTPALLEKLGPALR